MLLIHELAHRSLWFWVLIPEKNSWILQAIDLISWKTMPCSNPKLSKARFKRRTSHVPNRMLIREIFCSNSFALDSAHEKFDVWTGPKVVFTWYRGDFHPGASSPRFLLMALYSFRWYYHKMSCRREFTRFLCRSEVFIPARKFIPVSCKHGMTVRFIFIEVSSILRHCKTCTPINTALCKHGATFHHAPVSYFYTPSQNRLLKGKLSRVAHARIFSPWETDIEDSRHARWFRREVEMICIYFAYNQPYVNQELRILFLTIARVINPVEIG